MMFPPYRDRYLPAMTLRQIRALPDKAWAPVILATGAIEQHGPHLPVAVDALMGQVWISRTLAKLSPEASCYVAPPVTIGKSNEHTGFPGTLMISRETLRQHIIAVARQIHSWEFRSLAVVNTHGGNVPVLIPTLREVRATFGLRAAVLQARQADGLSAQEAAFGIHAGEVETSWILAAARRLADPSKAECEYPAKLDDPGEVRPVAAPALVAWASRDVSLSGIMGDAKAATAEKGERWIERGSADLAEAILEACRMGKAQPS
jgi:creatinine amidohydrolase